MTDGRPKDKLLQFCKPSNNSSCPHSRHPPIRINRMAIRQLSKAEPLIDGPALLTPIPADVAELFYRDVFDLTVNCLISNGSFSSPAGLYSTNGHNAVVRPIDIVRTTFGGVIGTTFFYRAIGLQRKGSIFISRRIRNELGLGGGITATNIRLVGSRIRLVQLSRKHRNGNSNHHSDNRDNYQQLGEGEAAFLLPLSLIHI